jgi:hypothetical protein
MWRVGPPILVGVAPITAFASGGCLAGGGELQPANLVLAV